MTKRILTESSYTFSRYFDIPFETKDILAELGVTYTKTQSSLLPLFVDSLPKLEELAIQISEGYEYISMSSEQARREFLVAPVIRYVCSLSKKSASVEYPIRVSEILKGTLDYCIDDLVVIEAKKSDLDKGFTQLAVELIALDQWTSSDADILYGAVTTGDYWKFGYYHRVGKEITQITSIVTISDGLETVVRTLLGIISRVH